MGVFRVDVRQVVWPMFRCGPRRRGPARHGGRRFSRALRDNDHVSYQGWVRPEVPAQRDDRHPRRQREEHDPLAELGRPGGRARLGRRPGLAVAEGVPGQPQRRAPGGGPPGDHRVRRLGRQGLGLSAARRSPAPLGRPLARQLPRVEPFALACGRSYVNDASGPKEESWHPRPTWARAASAVTPDAGLPERRRQGGHGRPERRPEDSGRQALGADDRRGSAQARHQHRYCRRHWR
jgi:hypothetical protein